jgi:predicted site-specific integrase-resolvase
LRSNTQQNATPIKKPERHIIEKAILKAFGNISLIAKSLDVDRTTLYKWIEDENLKDALVEGRNSRIDFVESKLDQKINDGDTTAIIFFLKTQGKERGYVERQEFNHQVNQPIFQSLDIDVITDDSDSEDKETP